MISRKNNMIQKSLDNMGEIVLRADNIDILKTICAFLVICIHIPFPGMASGYLMTLTRIAVPIFFMITGYFYYDVVKSKRERKQIKKIVELFVLSNLIYLLYEIFCLIANGQNFLTFLSDAFSVKSLLKFVIFNESPFAGHLWYLGAILYVLLIIFLADKFNCRRILYCLLPFLLLGDLLLGKYSIFILNREFPYIIVRNFLFVGLPYFCLGCLIKEQNVKKGILSHSIKKLRICLFCIVLFAITSCLERYFLDVHDVNTTREHYISTTFLAVSVFLFVMYNKPKADTKISKVFSLIGRKYSTWIYILHPIFIDLLAVIIRRTNIYEVYKYIAPIIVYLITLFFIMFISSMRKRMFLNNKKGD